MTDKEVRMILHRVIDTCNWCRHENIRCEECNKLYGPCRRNMAILDLGKYFAPDWIPCSERLPEKFGKYLVTEANIFIPQIRLFEGTWDALNEVIAWMPLPPAFVEGDKE